MNDASSANAVGPRSGRCGRATAQSLEDMAIVDRLFLVGPEYVNVRQTCLSISRYCKVQEMLMPADARDHFLVGRGRRWPAAYDARLSTTAFGIDGGASLWRPDCLILGLTTAGASILEPTVRPSAFRTEAEPSLAEFWGSGRVSR